MESVPSVVKVTATVAEMDVTDEGVPHVPPLGATPAVVVKVTPVVVMNTYDESETFCARMKRYCVVPGVNPEIAGACEVVWPSRPQRSVMVPAVEFVGELDKK